MKNFFRALLCLPLILASKDTWAQKPAGRAALERSSSYLAVNVQFPLGGMKYPILSFAGDAYHIRPCESRKNSRIEISE